MFEDAIGNALINTVITSNVLSSATDNWIGTGNVPASQITKSGNSENQ
jgi:hypothetical protein